MQTPNDDRSAPDDSASNEAIRFMVLKAALFVAVPLLAAVIAAMWV